MKTKLNDFNKYPTKEKLDNMSYSDIDRLKSKIISSPTFYDYDAKKQDGNDIRYLDELDVYKKIRFRDREIDFFKKCIKNAEDWKQNGGDTNDTTYRGNNLISSICKTNGIDFLYKMQLKEDIDKLGTFKYIEVEIPEEIKFMKTNENKI